MQSRLGRRTFGPAMVLGPVVALLLLVGVVLAVTRSGAETDVVVDDAGDPTSVTNGDDPSGADDDPDRPDGVESLAEGTIGGGGVSVNGVRQDDSATRLPADALVGGRYVLLQKGRRSRHLLIAD